MTTLCLSLHSNLRGPGFWKLNTSFLTELDYVNQIKTTIQETLDEYKNDESVNPSLLWEMIKLKVRERSLRYSKSKTKQARKMLGTIANYLKIWFPNYRHADDFLWQI